MTAPDPARVGRLLSLDEYTLTRVELAQLLEATAHRPRLDVDDTAGPVDQLVTRCWRELIATDRDLADEARVAALTDGADPATTIAIAHLLSLANPLTQET